ncbi:DUF5302 domain-containing protein [Luteimicrobium sp. NPDC057192]|uniref:DUF5302 domain-containing protein n=1 Tax=Luteimicrobium sp. NPDC057192 TaxID=3346042 RepID=UPI00362BCB95
MSDPGHQSDEEVDAVKAKFREALDRKKAAQHTSASDGARDRGAVHGSETQGPVRREFRRKSG